MYNYVILFLMLISDLMRGMKCSVSFISSVLEDNFWFVLHGQYFSEKVCVHTVNRGFPQLTFQVLIMVFVETENNRRSSTTILKF